MSEDAILLKNRNNQFFLSPNFRWPGCLQYYTATANNIQNFGFPPTITTVTAGVTHLTNQHYDICIRRASGSCYICYRYSFLENTLNHHLEQNLIYLIELRKMFTFQCCKFLNDKVNQNMNFGK